jgi:hypothetical protein
MVCGSRAVGFYQGTAGDSVKFGEILLCQGSLADSLQLPF